MCYQANVIELVLSPWKVGAVTATAGSSVGTLLAVILTTIESLSSALTVNAGAYPPL